MFVFVFEVVSQFQPLPPSHAVDMQIPRFRVRERLRKGFAQRRRSWCQVDERIIPPEMLSKQVQFPMCNVQASVKQFPYFNHLINVYISISSSFPFQPRLSYPFQLAFPCVAGSESDKESSAPKKKPIRPEGPDTKSTTSKNGTTRQIPSEIRECSRHRMLQAKEKCMHGSIAYAYMYVYI